jgi:hypothetical protein
VPPFVDLPQKEGGRRYALFSDAERPGKVGARCTGKALDHAISLMAASFVLDVAGKTAEEASSQPNNGHLAGASAA